MGCLEAAGDLSRELKFGHVSGELGSDPGETMVFMGALLLLGTVPGRAKWRAGSQDAPGVVGCTGTLTDSWQGQVSGGKLGMCEMGSKSAFRCVLHIRIAPSAEPIGSLSLNQISTRCLHVSQLGVSCLR